MLIWLLSVHVTAPRDTKTRTGTGSLWLCPGRIGLFLKEENEGQKMLIFSALKRFWPWNPNNWLVHLLHLKKKSLFYQATPLDPPPSFPLARPLASSPPLRGEKLFTSASPPCLSGSWVPNETRRCLTASFRAGRQAGCQRSMLLAKVDKKGWL